MDWKKELQKKGANKAFFYVTLDPERALGLEDVLPNYTIICPYLSQLTARLKDGTRNNRDRKDTFQLLALEEHIPTSEVEGIIRRGTYGILLSRFVTEHIKKCRDSKKNVYVLVLKNSQLIEGYCRKQGWRLLTPSAKVAEEFENKISQYRLLKDVVCYADTFLCTVEEFSNAFEEFDRDYSRTSAGDEAWRPAAAGRASPGRIKQARLACERFLNNIDQAPSRTPFVLQFNRGHSGNSTFFIGNRKDLAELRKKYPKRECKVSEYIQGKTYTLNCLALKSGKVINGSISEQITGLQAATSNPNTTCGNDFNSPRKLGIAEVKAIGRISQKVGKILHKNGYRGLFGIDVIIEKATGKVYFIELNTHQPASVSFEAKLHREIGKVPLLGYFILDSFGIKVRFPRKDLPPIVLPISAKQVIYRNKAAKILTGEYIEKEYRGKGLLSRMKFIKPNEEIYRIQTIK